MTGVFAVLHLVDQALRMLDAHAEGEGLGFEAHAAIVQEVKHVAGRVAGGEHDGGDVVDAADVVAVAARAL